MSKEHKKTTMTIRVTNKFKHDITEHLLPGESMTAFIEAACQKLFDERAEYAEAVRKARSKLP